MKTIRQRLTPSGAKDLVADLFLEMGGRTGTGDAGRGTVASWLSLRIRSRLLIGRAPRSERLGPLDEMESLAMLTEETGALERQQLREPALARFSPPERPACGARGKGSSHREMARPMANPFGTGKSRSLQALAKLLENEERP